MKIQNVVRYLLVLTLLSTAMLFGPSLTTDFCWAGSPCQITPIAGKITCQGDCPSSSRPKCTLQYRQKGSEKPWQTDPENLRANDPQEEYRCTCRR